MPRIPTSGSLAAAYPASPVSGTNYPFPSFPANSYSFTPGSNLNSVWGVPTAGQFPDIAPAQAPIVSGGSSTTENGQIPMLPGMEDLIPQRVARSLWYRTTTTNDQATGDSADVEYGKARDLFIYNTSYDSTVANPSASGTFNTNQPAPLILPSTVCIDTATGLVDKTCASTPSTTAAANASYLSLNAPVNNVFPNNSSTNQPASSFTVCGVTGNSRRYQAYEQRGTTLRADITGSSCPTGVGNPRSAIVTFASGLSATNFTTGEAVSLSGTAPNFTVNAVSSTKVNVLDLTAANFTSLLNSTLTLSANGNSDPTFVLRAPNSDVTIDGLYVKLKGVDPNKVFWLFPRTGPTALTIGRSAATIASSGQNSNPTVLVGNFIGTMPATGGTKADSTGLNIGPTYDGKGVAIRSARFLGFRAVTVATAQSSAELTAAPASPPATAAIGVDSTATITAMTTVDQPIVVPVLQLHSPITATVPTSSLSIMPQLGSVNKYTGGINGVPTTTDGIGQWTQRASATKVNIYFVAGNTPSRSYVPYTTSATAVSAGASIFTAETGGGLHNFVRFMENWRGQTLNISGGFIQNTRSVFATAPFSSTAPYTSLSLSGCYSGLTYATRNTCIETSSDMQTWFTNPNAVSDPLSNFSKYYQSATVQSIPFYAPPVRKWGFDVGLLVQQPDLFAQRFSQALPNPNEFFREAPKTDPWVQTMLCALQPAPASLGTNNPATSADPKAINSGSPQRVGTKPPNYTAFALGANERASASCPAIPTYNPAS